MKTKKKKEKDKKKKRKKREKGELVMPEKKTAVAKGTASRKSNAARTNGPVRVTELMAKNLHTCHAGDSLAAAASWMWQADCGSLPVLDDHGQLCGWITDRDISMALGMQAARATDLQVSQIMNGPVHRCRTEDKVTDALDLMATRQVRRIAVVDESDALVGVLSIADLVRAAKPRASADAPSVAQVFEALRAIDRPYGVTATL